jgi:hypothetical protein
MKYLILFLICFSAYAKVVETETAFQLEISSSDEAKNLYHMLSVPIDFGTKVTGKPHAYKIFEDKNKNFYLYCAEKRKNDFQCIYSINKVVVGDDAALENDNFQIHIMTTDIEQGKKLFDSMSLEPMYHGNYAIKVMSDELPSFGVSCMTDTSTFSEYQCDIRIFK